MRIALCTVQVPFVRGGAEALCDNLYREMIKSGYEVEYIKVPFKWYPPEEVINGSLAWRLLDLSVSNGIKIDGIIGTKFPSYIARHENKVVWLLHQHRSAYDNAHTKYDDLALYGRTGEIVRGKIHAIDNRALSDAKKVFTISRNVSNRLLKYNGIKSDPVYHPPPLMDRYRCEDYHDYVFYPSRLDSLKRQDLAIESMRHVRSDVRLKIAGAGPDEERYKQLARDLLVADRVDFLGRVSDDELLDLYANCLGVVYPPFDEDLGYITMEAFLSRKPVITTTDSGGALEFVDDGVNGYIADPAPEKIAEKIDLLCSEGSSKKLGANGCSKIVDMNLSWDETVKRLVEPLL